MGQVSTDVTLGAEATGSNPLPRSAAAFGGRGLELESVLFVQRRLTRIAVECGGRAALLHEVGRLTGVHVVFDSLVGKPAPNAVPVEAGLEVHGWLVPEAADIVDCYGWTEILEHLAGLVALEMIRDRALFDAEWNLRGDLLSELLHLQDLPSSRETRRAEQLGLDLAIPRRIVVLEPATEPPSSDLLIGLARRALRDSGATDGSMVGRFRENVAIAVPAEVEVSSLVRRLRKLDGKRPLWIVAGASAAHMNLSAAAKEAEAVLGLAREGSRRQPLVLYEDFGPLRFLLDAPDTSQMIQVVRQYLGDLSEHDHRRRSDLMRTLEAFLDCGGHHPSTAKRCHIHGSTVKYRLGVIREIVGRPLSDPTVRFELGIAFAVRNVLETLGVDPFPVGPKVSDR